MQCAQYCQAACIDQPACQPSLGPLVIAYLGRREAWEVGRAKGQGKEEDRGGSDMVELGPPFPPPNGARTCTVPQSTAQHLGAVLHHTYLACSQSADHGSTVEQAQLPQKLNLPTPGLPTKSSAFWFCLCFPALPHPTTRLLALPSTLSVHPEQRDDGLGLCLRRARPCYKPPQDSSSPILSSHIPRLPERRTAR